MKRRRLINLINTIMVIVILISMLSIIDYAWAVEQSFEESLIPDQEKDTNLHPINQEDEMSDGERSDIFDEAAAIPEISEGLEIPEALGITEQAETMGVSPLSEIMPLNATIYNENNVRDLRSRITGLNPTQTPVVIIRIPNNLSWQAEGMSGAIPVSHPNLTIEAAGSGHFSLSTSTSGAFLVRRGGNLTLRGGPGGGRLTIQGNMYDTGCLVQGTLTIENGVVITNYPMSGVDVQSGGILNLSGDARLHRNRNRQGPGGGVRVRSGGVFNMDSGIIEFNTGVQGGGVHVEQGGVFHMEGGLIRNNFSVNSVDWKGDIVYGSGGGLFVPTSNLNNVTIDPAAVFTNNVAESGKRINTDLANQYRNTINPGTVTVTDLGLYLTEEGNYAQVSPHAFTNYDINTDLHIPQFWQVSYQVMSDNGKIVAKFATTGEEIPSGVFVPEGTEVIFIPNPASLLDSWEVGTRITIIDEEGDNVPFQYVNGGTTAPLVYKIAEHTHIRGYFSEDYSTTLTVSKEVTGSFGNKNMPFTFEIFFETGQPLTMNEPLQYTIIDENMAVIREGTLTLDELGKIEFELSHGQTIRFEEVSLNYRIQIFETPVTRYKTSFVDSENPDVSVAGNNTEIVEMSVERRFHFTNEREYVPPTNVNAGNTKAMWLLGVVTILPALTGVMFKVAYRCRSR